MNTWLSNLTPSNAIVVTFSESEIAGMNLTGFVFGTSLISLFNNLICQLFINTVI